MLKTISATDASRMLQDGATLIDVRETDEHAREHIPGASSLPLSKLHEMELTVAAGHPVLFHCRSGARTDRDHEAFHRLFLCGVGNDDAAGGFFFGVEAADHRPVVQGTKVHVICSKEINSGAWRFNHRLGCAQIRVPHGAY